MESELQVCALRNEPLVALLMLLHCVGVESRTLGLAGTVPLRKSKLRANRGDEIFAVEFILKLYFLIHPFSSLRPSSVSFRPVMPRKLRRTRCRLRHQPTGPPPE